MNKRLRKLNRSRERFNRLYNAQESKEGDDEQMVVERPVVDDDTTSEDLENLGKLEEFVTAEILPKKLDTLSVCSDTSCLCVNSIRSDYIEKEEIGIRTNLEEDGCQLLIDQITAGCNNKKCIIYEIKCYIPGISNHCFNIYQYGKVGIIGNSWAGHFRYQTKTVKNIVEWAKNFCLELEKCIVTFKTFLEDGINVEELTLTLSKIQETLLSMFGVDDPVEKSIIGLIGEDTPSDVKFNSPEMRSTKPPHSIFLKKKHFMHISTYYIKTDVFTQVQFPPPPSYQFPLSPSLQFSPGGGRGPG